MTRDSSARQRYARLVQSLSVFGLVGLALAALYWPTNTRKIEHLLNEVSELLACDGPLTADRAVTAREAIAAHFSQETTLTIAGPPSMNGAFDHMALLDELRDLCANTNRFRAEFSQISVDVTDDERSGTARADISVEYVVLGRSEHERRQVRFTFRKQRDAFVLVSADLGPSIVTQPEPRP